MKNNIISFAVGVLVTSAAFFFFSGNNVSSDTLNKLGQAKKDIVVLDSLYQSNLKMAEENRLKYLHHLDSLSATNSSLDSLNKVQIEILYEEDHTVDNDSLYNSIKLIRFKWNMLY